MPLFVLCPHGFRHCKIMREVDAIHIKKTVAAVLSALFALLPMHAAARDGFTMSYLFGNYDYSALVESSCGILDEVSPGWFDIGADGSLIINDPDCDLISEMHAGGIRVVPFLSNHWDRAAGRKALARGEELALALAGAVEKYGLDGVNVDIENLNESDRDDYTAFTAALRAALGPDRVLAVAVAANPGGWQSGWHGSYDYSALAEYADYLMLMAYDEHYQGGEPGPVASLDFVERSVQYALGCVPAEKIVLGIPFYGRYWKSGESGGGRGVAQNRAEEIFAAYDCRSVYDESFQSLKAEVTIKDGDALPRISGHTLTPGTYIFWCENEDSIRRKLALAEKYALAGTGSWSLGQEGAGLWMYYRAAINGLTDVRGRDWFCLCACQAVESGLMDAPGGLFSPGAGISRGDFILALYRMEGCPSASGESGFFDAGEYSEAMSWAAEQGIAAGRPDGSFAPYEALRRQDAAVFIFRFARRYGYMQGTAPAPPNEDAPLISPYAVEAVGHMLDSGIFAGTDEGLIMPGRECTRAQAAAMLMRLKELVSV